MIVEWVTASYLQLLIKIDDETRLTKRSRKKANFLFQREIGKRLFALFCALSKRSFWFLLLAPRIWFFIAESLQEPKKWFRHAFSYRTGQKNVQTIWIFLYFNIDIFPFISNTFVIHHLVPHTNTSARLFLKFIWGAFHVLEKSRNKNIRNK